MNRHVPAFACLAILATCASACSSSSSDPYAEVGGVRACGGSAKVATPCDACVIGACLAEVQAVSGTDPSRFGGACEANDSCMCACAREGTKSQSECQQACQDKLTQDCARARQAALRCSFAAFEAGGRCNAACAR